MPEYLGFEFTEEEARQYIGTGILWGLLAFSVGITTVDFFRKYSIKFKVIIVEKDPQN
jgi:hypothetical protein